MLGNNDPLQEFTESCSRDKDEGKVVCKFEGEDDKYAVVEVEQRPDTEPELDDDDFSRGLTVEEKEEFKKRTLEQARKRFGRRGGALSGHTE